MPFAQEEPLLLFLFLGGLLIVFFFAPFDVELLIVCSLLSPVAAANAFRSNASVPGIYLRTYSWYGSSLFLHSGTCSIAFSYSNFFASG